MEINQLVTELWDDHITAHDLLSRGACYHELEPNRPVLFMGLNPSYVAENPNAGLMTDGSHFGFKLPDERVSGYYSHIYELAEAMGIQRDQWTYQDVFYFRWTDQKTIPQNDAFHSFKLAHLILTQTVIEFLCPKLIVVCNSEAATYFGVRDRPTNPLKYMGYRFDEQQNKEGYILNPDTGCHQIRACSPHLDNGSHDALFRTKLVGTHIYFTSFSQYKPNIERERTGWHLSKIYAGLSK
jgi:hypothetical protein